MYRYSPVTMGPPLHISGGTIASYPQLCSLYVFD